jgi:hypothetical protein
MNLNGVAQICQTIYPFLFLGIVVIPHSFWRFSTTQRCSESICRQVARVFPKPEGPNGTRVFGPATMELVNGEQQPEANQKVLFVRSPGMKKRGRSTGEDLEDILIISEVSCEPVEFVVEVQVKQEMPEEYI